MVNYKGNLTQVGVLVLPITCQPIKEIIEAMYLQCISKFPRISYSIVKLVFKFNL